MKILSSLLLISGSILLSGCDMELSPEAKSKVEETRQAADASVDELKSTLNSELQKTKDSALTKTQEAITSGLSEETNKQIDSVRQKAEDIGNMKVSELLSFGGDGEEESEGEENQ